MGGSEPVHENSSAFASLMDRDRRAEVDAIAAWYADKKRRRLAARRSPDTKSLDAQAAPLVPGAQGEAGGGVAVSDGLFNGMRRARLFQHIGGLSGEGSGSDDHADRCGEGDPVLARGRGTRRRWSVLWSAVWSVLGSASEGGECKATVYCYKQCKSLDG